MLKYGKIKEPYNLNEEKMDKYKDIFEVINEAI